jgi:Notch-like protein
MKSRLYKKFLKNPTPENKNKYICYRNKLKSTLHKAEKDFYRAKFKQFQGNLTQTWKVLGSLLNKNKQTDTVKEFLKDGVKITDPQEIVEHFNDFFVNIGETLAKSITAVPTLYSSFLSSAESYKESFSLFLTDATEVIRIAHDLSDKSSFGVDHIPMNILKKCIYQVAEPLATIINYSLSSGRVPDMLKIAKVCPIFKSDADNIFSNHRPISILPSFSKVFEKVVCLRLSNYLTSKCILSNNQYGFRQNHSTYMAILDVRHKYRDYFECS